MRVIALALGLLALAAAWLAPIPAGHFTDHMTRHMLLVAVASPLLAVAAAGTRFDPALRAPRLLAPVPLSMLELIAVWAWHVPLLHGAAREHALVGAAEQATFLVTGLALWTASAGGRPGRARTGAGVLALLLTSMHMTLLGALLALGTRPLYTHATLEDQHLGGAVMILVGGIAYLAGGLALAARLLGPEVEAT